MADLSSKTARLAIVSLVVVLVACGGGDSSQAPPVATSIAPNSLTSLTAVAGAAVTEVPSVIVKDQRGAAMPGVPVGFTVTSGGGTIRGRSATTDASGVASVAGWTLGLVAGSNSLTASASGLPSVTFVASGTPSAITSVLLPTLGGAISEASAVNDGGVVVGLSTDNAGNKFAVRWTRTSSDSWNIAKIAGLESWAVAINVNGTAVGIRGGRAKLWPATGGEIDLGPGEPNGINAAETVVGVRRDPSNPAELRAVVWRKPSTGWDPLVGSASEDLPPFPAGTGWTVARAINDAGVIAGNVGVRSATSVYYAVRWDPVGDQWTQPVRLPGTDAFYSTAGRAINDKPQADIAGAAEGCLQCLGVGMFWPSGSSAASLEAFWGGGGPGFIWGMNNAQRVVGSRGTTYFENPRAFVWWPGQASVQEFGAPGYTDTRASDINNLSPAQAVGYGQNTNEMRGIVWTIP